LPGMQARIYRIALIVSFAATALVLAGCGGKY
jgi:predicted small secreted protein